MHANLSLMAVLFIFTFTNVFKRVELNYVPYRAQCKLCMSQEECDAAPAQLCIWGESRDACNRRVCAKGPGELCGGRMNVLGDCGEGLMCKADGRCHGCSIDTMQCYY